MVAKNAACGPPYPSYVPNCPVEPQAISKPISFGVLRTVNANKSQVRIGTI